MYPKRAFIDTYITIDRSAGSCDPIEENQRRVTKVFKEEKHWRTMTADELINARDILMGFRNRECTYVKL